jgi:hypothetical protein
VERFKRNPAGGKPPEPDVGDRDAYIIGAVGMVTFLFLSFLVRRANRT